MPDILEDVEIVEIVDTIIWRMMKWAKITLT
jgi:hypothetical protein